MTKKQDTVQVAGVDEYVERPLADALRTPEENAEAEGRQDAVDQIPDYHQTHPTLDASGPQYDAAGVLALLAAAQAKAERAVAKAAEQADDEQPEATD